jgi:hypothetical protein
MMAYRRMIRACVLRRSSRLLQSYNGMTLGDVHVVPVFS